EGNLAAKGPVCVASRSVLGGVLNNLALVRRDQDRHDEACQLLQTAVEHQKAALKQAPNNATYREFLRNHYWNLAEALLKLGRYPDAAEAAAELPRLYPDGWREHVRAGGYLSRCVGLAAKDAKLSELKRQQLTHSYGDQAMTLLHEAVARGWRDAQALKGPLF